MPLLHAKAWSLARVVEMLYEGALLSLMRLRAEASWLDEKPKRPKIGRGT